MSKIIKEMLAAAEGLNRIGLVDNKTLDKIKQISIPEIHSLTPEQIKSIREKERVSQVIFAKCLHTSTSLIRKWETGERIPHGLALMTLNMIEKKGLRKFINY